MIQRHGTVFGIRRSMSHLTLFLLLVVGSLLMVAGVNAQQVLTGTGAMSASKVTAGYVPGYLPPRPPGYVPRPPGYVPGYIPPTPGYQRPAPGYVPPAPGYIPPRPPGYVPGYIPPTPGYQRPNPGYLPPRPPGYIPRPPGYVSPVPGYLPPRPPGYVPSAPGGSSVLKPQSPFATHIVDTGTSNSFQLSWRSVSGTDRFRIYRASVIRGVDQFFTLIAQPEAGVTQWYDNSVQAGTSYHYYIVSVSSAGLMSDKVYFGLPAQVKPQPKIGPIVNPPVVKQGQVTLSWWRQSYFTSFVSVNIYRSTVAGSLGSRIATNVGGFSFVDRSARPGMLYYTIRAVTSHGSESTNTDQHSVVVTGK